MGKAPKLITLWNNHRVWFCYPLHLIDETIKSQRGDMASIVCLVNVRAWFLTGASKFVPTKIQVVNGVGLARPVVSVVVTCLHPNNAKTTTNDTEASNHHCAPIKLYLYKQAKGRIGPMGCMKNSALFALISSFHTSVSTWKNVMALHGIILSNLFITPLLFPWRILAPQKIWRPC